MVDSATASLTARSVLAVLAGIGISTGKYWTVAQRYVAGRTLVCIWNILCRDVLYPVDSIVTTILIIG